MSLNRTPPFEDRDVETAAGRFHYVKAGEGTALVLIHGMAASAWSWSRAIPRLAPRFTAYAPDLLGHGGSEARRDTVSVQHHAAALCAFLDELRIERCLLAGSALGSLIAMEVALIRPSEIVGALLLGTPHFSAEAARWGWLSSRALTFVDEQGRGIPMREPAVRERYQAYTPTLVEELNRERARSGLWALHDVWAIAAYNAARAAASLSVPAAFCYGDHDPFLAGRPSLMEAAPQARHLVLEGVGHYPAWDDPERVANLAAELLA